MISNETQAWQQEALKKMEDLNKNLAESSVLIDRMVRRVEKNEQAAAERLKENEAFFQNSLEELKQLMTHLKELLSVTDMDHFKALTAANMQESQSQLSAIHQASEDFRKLVESGAVHLHQTAESVSAWITDSVKSLKIEDFRKLMVNSVNQLDEISNKAVAKINQMTRWFHWEKVILCVIATFLSAFLTVLFINSESPFVTHAQAASEREAGKFLLKAWDQLTPNEKQHIEQIANNGNVL